MADLLQPGLRVVYNHDLKVADELLESYPVLRTLLRDDRLNGFFDSYDKTARHHKQMFYMLGLCSLMFGFVSLAAADLYHKPSR